eukprot:1269366-Alexandrium_andersonii.AAC.1
MRVEAGRLKADAQRMTTRLIKARRERTKVRLADKRAGTAAVFKALRAEALPSLAFLKGPEGKLVSSPGDLDR